MFILTESIPFTKIEKKKEILYHKEILLPFKFDSISKANQKAIELENKSNYERFFSIFEEGKIKKYIDYQSKEIDVDKYFKDIKTLKNLEFLNRNTDI